MSAKDKPDSRAFHADLPRGGTDHPSYKNKEGSGGYVAENGKKSTSCCYFFC